MPDLPSPLQWLLLSVSYALCGAGVAAWSLRRTTSRQARQDHLEKALQSVSSKNPAFRIVPSGIAWITALVLLWPIPALSYLLTGRAFRDEP